MSNSQIEQLNKLLTEANQHLETSKNTLEELFNDPTTTEDLLTEEKAYGIQLILQYRLSCEDALALLLKIDHQILYSLGIQPQQSSKINLERLSYAVGHEDLKHILNFLANLVDSLSKIVSRYHKQQVSFRAKNKGTRKTSCFIQALKKLTAHHNHFLKTLTLSEHEINQLVKMHAVGPLFDHIAALQGPISQFHQILSYSMDQTKFLYQKINQSAAIDHQLDFLLKKAEDVLSLMPSLYKASPHHFAKPLNDKMTPEQLEARAAAKRLLPFFS